MIRREVSLWLSLPDSGRRQWGKRMIKSRAMLLAGVSALAMLACVAKRTPRRRVTGGVQSFTVPTTGEYALDVLGASGERRRRRRRRRGPGRRGFRRHFPLRRRDLTLFVGGQGEQGQSGGRHGGGGGGGGGFVFLGTNVLAVAGGGGGGAI